MAINKIIYGNSTLLDLSEDTVTSQTLLKNITAHGKDGNIVTGSVVVQNYRTGTSEPSNSLGNNGDLYLVLEA